MAVVKTAAQWCRKSVEQKERDHAFFGRCLRFSAISIIALLLQCATSTLLHARDCGVHGTISEIEEEDPIVLIQTKLKRLEDSGELEKHKQALQKKAKESVERPKPVKGITRALKNRVWYFDPTYTVEEDLMDHKGRVFAKKGTKINPLETVPFSDVLIFFNGDDQDQKAWVEEQIGEHAALQHTPPPRKALKLILVKGAPLALSETWDRAVYFDQGGFITEKLGIQHVPARVTQKGLLLRVEEIDVKENL